MAFGRQTVTPFCMLMWLAIGILGPVSLSQAQSLSELEAQMAALSPPERLAWVAAQRPTQGTPPTAEHAQYWYLFGLALDANQQTEQAIDAFTRAITLFDEQQLPLSAILPLSYIERSYMRYLQSNDPALYCPDRVKALTLARQLAEPQLLVKVLTQNAFCYGVEPSQLNQGLALLAEAIKVAERYQLPKNQYGMIHNATGNLYRRNQILDKAYDSILIAYQAWAEVEDIQDMFNMQHILVGLAIELQQFDKAQQHVQILYRMARDYPQFKDFRFFADFNGGWLALAQDQPEDAATYLQHALDRRETTQESYFVKHAEALLVQALFKAERGTEAQAALTRLTEDWPEHEQWPAQIKSLHAYYQGDNAQAMQLMMRALDDAVHKRRAFVTQYQRASTQLFDDNLAALDNKILQQDLEIQRLELAKEQTQKRIAQITVLFSALILLGLSGFIWHLIKTRRLFRHRAQTDYLTQVANRRSIFEQGHALVSQRQQSQQPLSLLVFDVDHFKQVNDRLGHEHGDNALKLISQRARRCLRQQDRIGRIGGEEFLVLLPNADGQQAQQIAERIRLEVEKAPLRKEDGDYRLTVSLGTATVKPQESLEAAMARADAALYRAKANGRNQVVVAG